MAVTFGLNIDTGTYGICHNIERENTAETATYMGADGDTEGYTSHDEQETITLTYVTDGTPAPTAGGTMSIDTKTYLVETVKQVQSQNDYERFEISGRRWVPNTIPA